jgi:hypothetical protein
MARSQLSTAFRNSSAKATGQAVKDATKKAGQAKV